MRLPALALIIACAPPAPPPLPLDQPGGVPVVRLDLATAQVRLPHSRDGDASGHFVLGEPQPAQGLIARRLGATLAYALPFRPTAEDYRFATPGLRVIADGQDVPYVMSRADRNWRFEDDELVLAWPDRPGRVEISHPLLASRLARLDPDRSGLDPASHVHYSVTLGDETRGGLMLPTGGEIVWTMDLPASATFQTSTALVPSPLSAPGPATLILSLDGREVARRTQEPGEVFQDWQVPLSNAGSTHSLGLRAEGGDGAGLPFLAHPTVVGAAAPAPARRVVWIGLDTTRRDHLGVYAGTQGLTPNLDRWASGAAVFDDAVTPAPRTRPSFRTALTGLRPLDAVGAPTFLNRLHEAGFDTAAFVANLHLNRRFGFTDGADRWHLSTSADAAAQVDRSIAWLDEHKDRDSALFVHFMDPHLRYAAPAPFTERFVKDPVPDLPLNLTRGQILQMQHQGRLGPRIQDQLRGRYAGEVAYMDQELGRLLDHIDSLPGPSLVVLHNDHGEEHWDHGGFEHNHTLKPEVVDAVVIIDLPGTDDARRVTAPVGLDDLVPTVFDLLAVPLPEQASTGRSLRPLIEGGTRDEAPRGVAHLMYDTERWGVRWKDHTYILHTGSGQEELYDRRVDPAEDRDLVPSGTDPAPWRAALGQAHGTRVGPGWRARFVLGPEPVTWTLPAPALAAGVMDPESLSSRRANQVWGERPEHTPSDVATVVLSDDGTTLTITPGPLGRGTLWVLFSSPVTPGGIITRGAQSLAVDGGPQRGLPGVPELDVRDGTVLEPVPGEAARLAAERRDLDDVSESDAALLRRLGYLDDGDGISPTTPGAAPPGTP